MMKIDTVSLEIELKKLQLRNNYRSLTIEPFSFSLDRQNPFAVIHGPSGSGKTTFFRSFYFGFLQEWQLEKTIVDIKENHLINGIPLKKTQHCIGYAPQRPFFLPRKTVKENLLAPFKWRSTNIVDNEKFESIKKHLFLDSFIEGRLAQLSAGEKQRLNLARTLITSPKVMLIDECLTSLDESLANEIVGNLHKYYSSECAFLIISHRPNDLANVPHKVIRFKAEEENDLFGKVNYDKTVKVTCS